jgi:hypothetical protein
VADYPVKVPPGLVQQWLCSDDFLWGPLEQTSMTITTNRLQNVAAQAAQWGANQCAAVNEAELQKARDEELKACLWHLESTRCNQIVITTLRAARRPKPLTLAHQALIQYDRFVDMVKDSGCTPAGCVRDALKRLAELEAAQ